MKYENPIIPEGINTPRRRSLPRLACLLAVIGVLFLVALLLLRQVAEWMAPQIPFAWEKRLMDGHPPVSDDRRHPHLLSYLQWLARRLAEAGGLPEEITVTVHYRDEPTVNAVAGLGGHITIYRGLLERAGSENALALVMAHEIAHIERRHPLKNLGSRAMLGVVLAAVGGATGDSLAEWLLGRLGAVAELGFSREQERQADAAALAAVYSLYGHLSGAFDLFESLLREKDSLPEFMQTHPAMERRLEDLRDLAREQGWSDEGPVLMLPRFTEPYFPD